MLAHSSGVGNFETKQLFEISGAYAPGDFITPRADPHERLPVADCAFLAALLGPRNLRLAEQRHPGGIDAATEKKIIFNFSPSSRAGELELTAIETHGPLLAKKWVLGADGTPACQQYGNAKRFDAAPVAFHSVDDFAARLEAEFIGNPRRALIRAELLPDECPHGVLRRLHGRSASFQPAPLGRRWLVADLDGVEIPEETFARGPAVVFEWVKQLLPPELRAADFVWQVSASYGFKGGRVSGHLFFMLSRPIRDGDAEKWLLAMDVERGATLFDPTVARPAQLVYTAAPLFDRVPDPLAGEARVGVIRGERPTVEVPASVPTPAESWRREAVAARERREQREEQERRRIEAEARREANAVRAGNSGNAPVGGAGQPSGARDWRTVDLPALYAAHGMLGREIKPGVWAARCVLEHEHTTIAPADGSDCAIVRTPGGFVVKCLHSHADRANDPRTIREFFGTVEFEKYCAGEWHPAPRQTEIDDTEAGVGAQARPIQSITPIAPRPDNTPALPAAIADAIFGERPVWQPSREEVAATALAARRDDVARKIASCGDPATKLVLRAPSGARREALLYCHSIFCPKCSVARAKKLADRAERVCAASGGADRWRLMLVEFRGRAGETVGGFVERVFGVSEKIARAIRRAGGDSVRVADVVGAQLAAARMMRVAWLVRLADGDAGQAQTVKITASVWKVLLHEDRTFFVGEDEAGDEILHRASPAAVRRVVCKSLAGVPHWAGGDPSDFAAAAVAFFRRKTFLPTGNLRAEFGAERPAKNVAEAFVTDLDAVERRAAAGGEQAALAGLALGAALERAERAARVRGALPQTWRRGGAPTSGWDARTLAARLLPAVARLRREARGWAESIRPMRA